MGLFLLTTASRSNLGSSQTPIQWVPAVKRTEHEADHSFASSAEVKNVWSYAYNPAVLLHVEVLN
jgi:hypothetical protein